MGSSNASLSGTRQMNQAVKAQEPSMEEILASIRRIIADDDAAKGPPAPPESSNAPPVAAAPLRPPPPEPPAPAFVPVPVPANEPSVNETALDEMLAELNATPAHTEEMASDVLDLTEAMAGPDPAASEFRTIDGQSDIVFEDSPPHEFAEPAAPYDAPRPQFPERAQRALMSSATSAAVDSAFNTLAHTVLVQNARTLEDLVKEMLQPLLKSWLDDNLPGLVERLVKAEIERVSRGRG
jgi:cell pole-organizing protein PopZ